MIRARRTESQNSMIRIMEQLALAWESGSTAHPRPSASKKKRAGAQDQLAGFAPKQPKTLPQLCSF